MVGESKEYFRKSEMNQVYFLRDRNEIPGSTGSMGNQVTSGMVEPWARL